ncbi:hypothetical protein LVJ94_50870 [Pendulispora rubella]|uniref:Uncharacterized protein n=1 Tax=Pendulispora rubella TaxID=2741070 RepID=A0ABZ2L5E8_9BACT
MIRRRVIAAFSILLSACLGCGSSSPPVSSPRVPCLSGDVPRTGRPAADEMFAFLRREWARAQSPSVVGAHILETIPSLFPDGRDLLPEPSCSPDFRLAMRDGTFGHGEVVFSRMLIARLLAVGAIDETTDTMAAYFMRLVDLNPDQLTPYRPSPDEEGPNPPKSVIRYLALDRLVHSSFSRVPEARAFLRKLVYAPRDDREALIVARVAYGVVESPRWNESSPEARNLLRAWIPDVRRRLNVPRDGRTSGVDAISFELVMHHLESMRVLGSHLHADPAARALMTEIVGRRGDYPLTKGLSERSFDLAVVASGALYALDVPRHPLYPGRAPPPTRTVFSATKDLVPPEYESVGTDAGRQRMRELDGELEDLRLTYTRCAVLREQAHWVPDVDAETRFRDMSSEIFAWDGSVLSTGETECRIRSAADIRGAGDDERIAMLVRVLETTDTFQMQDAAIAAVLRHPEWIARSKELRHWFYQVATRTGVPNSTVGESWLAVHPVFDVLLSFLADRGEFAKGRAILIAFMATIREAAKHAETYTSIYPYEVAILRLYSVARYAVAFGLRGEAAALVASLPEGATYQKYGPAQRMASTMIELSAN